MTIDLVGEIKPSRDCIDDLALSSYAAGNMWKYDREQFDMIAGHLEHCVVCKFDLREIERHKSKAERLTTGFSNFIRSPQPARVRVTHAITALLLVGGCATFWIWRESEKLRYTAAVRRETSELVKAANQALDESNVGMPEVFRNVVFSGKHTADGLPILSFREDPSVIARGLSSDSDVAEDYGRMLSFVGTVFMRYGDSLTKQSDEESDQRTISKTRTAAIEVYRALLERNIVTDPVKRTKIYFALGELLKRSGQHTQAVELYDKMALETEQPDPRPFHYVGFSLSQIGKFNDAIRFYDMAMEAHRKAVAIYRGTRQTYSSYPKLAYNRAKCQLLRTDLPETERQLLYKKELSEALSGALEAFRRDGTSDPRAAFVLALVYAEMRDPEKTLRFLERTFQFGDAAFVARAESDVNLRVFATDPQFRAYEAQFKALLNKFRTRREDLSRQARGIYDPSYPNE